MHQEGDLCFKIDRLFLLQIIIITDKLKRILSSFVSKYRLNRLQCFGTLDSVFDKLFLTFIVLVPELGLQEHVSAVGGVKSTFRRFLSLF